MHIACWIPKAKTTRSEYVILLLCTNGPQFYMTPLHINLNLDEKLKWSRCYYFYLLLIMQSAKYMVYIILKKSNARIPYEGWAPVNAGSDYFKIASNRSKDGPGLSKSFTKARMWPGRYAYTRQYMIFWKSFRNFQTRDGWCGFLALRAASYSPLTPPLRRILPETPP